MVTEPVIDLLEPIKIDIEHRHDFAPGSLGHCIVKASTERGAVEQSSQRIAHRHVKRPAFNLIDHGTQRTGMLTRDPDTTQNRNNRRQKQRQPKHRKFKKRDRARPEQHPV
jgi:hypothetical protein